MSERSLRLCSWWTPRLGVTVWHYCVRVHGKNPDESGVGARYGHSTLGECGLSCL